jgi:hypothetical protein
VLLVAGEVLQQVAELVGRDDLQVDADAAVRAGARTGLAAVRDRLDHVELREGGDQPLRVLGRGDDVEVLDRVGPASRRAGQLDAHGRGVVAQRLHDLVADRESAVEHEAAGTAGAGLVGRDRALDRFQQLRLGSDAKALQVLDAALSGGGRERLERVDPQLLVQTARALGPEARQARHLQQAGGELLAQRDRLRDVALVQ